MGSFRSYLTDWGMLGMHKRRAFERAVGGARDRLDLGQGRLRFSGGPSFYVQLLGTHAHATWLWGWANEAPLPAHVLRVAGTLRSWGERQGVAEMTSATVFDEAADPEALALVSCALTPCAGLYRCEADGGTIWLLAYGELDEQPLSAEDCLDTIHAFASRHAVDERRAVTSFFHALGVDVEEEEDAVRGVLPSGELAEVAFERGRIVGLRARQRTPSRVVARSGSVVVPVRPKIRRNAG